MGGGLAGDKLTATDDGEIHAIGRDLAGFDGAGGPGGDRNGAAPGEAEGKAENGVGPWLAIDGVAGGGGGEGVWQHDGGRWLAGLAMEQGGEREGGQEKVAEERHANSQ